MGRGGSPMRKFQAIDEEIDNYMHIAVKKLCPAPQNYAELPRISPPKLIPAYATEF